MVVLDFPNAGYRPEADNIIRSCVYHFDQQSLSYSDDCSVTMFLRKLLEQTFRKGPRCLSLPQNHKFCTSHICGATQLTGKEDRYNGVTIDLRDLPEATSNTEFGAILAGNSLMSSLSQ